ncbi:UMP kinase [Candidatus Bathyarchaeota archaeon]|nr:UMP kinase [Candidatus Bathyarchaeota archaeon]
MRIVIRVGGSVVATPVNPQLISRHVEVFRKLRDEDHKLAVVVGGGGLAREFIKIAKELGLREEDQDDLAIMVSRLFAQLFVKKLGELSCGKVLTSVEEAAQCLAEGKIAVLGGLKPGMTTDAVAALVAQRIGADLLVKATDQEGVYDKDPRKHSDAVKLDRLSFEDLPKVLAEKRHHAGIHQILDPEAVRLLQNQKIRVLVLNGFKPENIVSAIKGEKIGTIIE